MAASLKPEEFEQMVTLGDVARHHGRTRPSQIALSFEGRHTTYAELDARSNQVAAALVAADVEPGDCVCYLGKNSDHYFELLIGVLKIGAVIAPIGWRLSADEAAYIIDDAQAHMLFVGPECIGHAEDIVAKTASRPSIVAMEPGAHSHPTYEAWRDAETSDDLEAPVPAEATALLLYTSGTTGRPKGVMLSSANLLRSRRQLSEAAMGWNEWKEGEVNYTAMPIAHIGGTGWCLVGLINGVKNVIARDFNPMEALEAIERERIAKMFMVPAALQFIIRMPRAKEIDYSSLTHILYGASPMPVDLLRECMEVFGCKFVQQYGMTETT
ncbi:MAG: AMP-binding protein, partial [Hyphomonadaceae bacterium]